MKQTISCHKGKCVEEKDEKTDFFNKLYKEENILNKIEKDLWDKEIYKK